MSIVKIFIPNEVVYESVINSSLELKKEELLVLVLDEVGEDVFNSHRYSLYPEENDCFVTVYSNSPPSLGVGEKALVSIIDYCRFFNDNFVSDGGDEKSGFIYVSQDLLFILTLQGNKVISFSRSIDEDNFINEIASEKERLFSMGIEEVKVLSDFDIDVVETEAFYVDEKLILNKFPEISFMKKKTFMESFSERFRVKKDISLKELWHTFLDFTLPLSVLILVGYSLYLSYNANRFYENAQESMKDVLYVASQDMKKQIEVIKVPMDSLEKSVISLSDANLKLDKKINKIDDYFKQLDKKINILIRGSLSAGEKEKLLSIANDITKIRSDLNKNIKLIKDVESSVNLSLFKISDNFEAFEKRLNKIKENNLQTLNLNKSSDNKGLSDVKKTYSEKVDDFKKIISNLEVETLFMSPERSVVSVNGKEYELKNGHLNGTSIPLGDMGELKFDFKNKKVPYLVKYGRRFYLY